MQHNRNFDRIANEQNRKVIDPIIAKVHDELEDAYYQNWRQDVAKDFYGYNKQATVAESKAQFDQLHGNLFLLHEVLLHKQNLTHAAENRFPETRYNNIRDVDGNVVEQRDQKNLAQLKTKPALFANLKQILASNTQDTSIQTLISEIV